MLNCWTEHRDFVEATSHQWKEHQVSGWGGYICKEKLKHVKVFLKSWNTNQFGNFEEHIKQEVKRIAQLDLANESTDLTENEALLRFDSFKNIWKLLHRRQSSWRQKSRSTWFKMGDANTAYFHKFASHPRNRNTIQGLSINDNWVEDPASIKEEVAQYFSQRFSQPDAVKLKFPIQPAKTLPSDDQMWLERPFSMEEIKDVVWDCGSDKAPGRTYLIFI